MIPFNKRSKTHIITRSTKNIGFLLIGIILLFFLILLISFFSPNTELSFLSYKIPVLIVFFLLLFSTIFSLGTYIFKSKTQGVLFGLLIIGFLIFRVNNLTHPFFFILLGALFLTLELLFTYKK